MPSVNDNKQSMADMASKFADKDEEPEADDDDSSSFEEVQKPVERPSAVKAEPKTLASEPVKSKEVSTPSSDPADKADSVPVTEAQKEEATAAPAPSASAAAGGLRDVLQEIRGMLQAQGKQIEQLTSEVAQLKAKVGE